MPFRICFLRFDRFSTNVTAIRRSIDFVPPGADAEFQIVQPDKYYDQTMWFLDYRKRLMELRQDEQAALTNAIEADKK